MIIPNLHSCLKVSTRSASLIDDDATELPQALFNSEVGVGGTHSYGQDLFCRIVSE